MPLHEEHCRESSRKYGKRFDNLHRWMDEPSAILGKKHRMYRHNPYVTPKKAKELFGEFADDACLNHIKLDRTQSSKRAAALSQKRAVDQEDLKANLKSLFREVFQIMDEFPKPASWKQETKVQRKPRSGVGSWLQILLVSAALIGLAD